MTRPRHPLGPSRRALVLGAAALTACGPLREPPPLLRLASNVWIGYEPLYVARDRGLLPARVRMVELVNASQVQAVVRTSLVEAAALTLDESLLLLSHGVPLRVVGVFDRSNGGDALVARTATRLDELRGARVGVERTAVGAYFLARVLEEAGIDRVDLDVVPLDASGHVRAFLAGEVDALVTFEPMLTVLRSHGARVLFDSRELPDEIFDVLVARAEALGVPEHRAALAGVLAACDSVLDHLDEPTWRAMGRRMHLTPDDTRAAATGVSLTPLPEMRRLLLGPTPVLEGAARRIAEHLAAAGLIPAVPPLAGLVDPRPLAELGP